MTRLPRTLFSLAVPALAMTAPLAIADAAHGATATPTVSSVTPMQAGIGDTLTISGKNFRSGKLKNTVVFKRDGGKAVFVKAGDATSKQIRVKVPQKLASFLAKKSGKAVGTRFRLRVISKRFGKTYTAAKLSPTIAPANAAPADAPAETATPAPAPAAAAPVTVAAAPVAIAGGETAVAPVDEDCDADGQKNSVDGDDDNDGLSDVLENSLKTSTCLADSDGDTLQDGWEYQSAIDLNNAGCSVPAYSTPCTPATPYPGKRRYPNPLDPSDAQTDHDGDWLPNYEEHEAWLRKAGHTLASMWYSGGLQASQDSPATTTCVGLAVPAPYQAGYSQDRHNKVKFDGTSPADGCLNDAERDEDADLLTNREELTHQLSTPDWWKGIYNEVPFHIAYSGTNWLDRDSDGDLVPDGFDDQDFDDFLNLEEIERGSASIDEDGNPTSAVNGLWVDAFNPCLPFIESRTCPIGIPLEGAVWAPFKRASDPEIKPRWPLWPSDEPPVHGGNPQAPVLITVPS